VLQRAGSDLTPESLVTRLARDPALRDDLEATRGAVDGGSGGRRDDALSR
jgi:hypothetical protein